jgi:hypothetical protein
MSFNPSIRNCLDWIATFRSVETPRTEGSQMQDAISTFHTTEQQEHRSWLRGLGEEEEAVEEAVAARIARRNPHHLYPRRAETST